MDRKTEIFLVYAGPLLVSGLSLVGAFFNVLTTPLLLTALFSVIILQIGFVFQNFSNIFDEQKGELELALDHIRNSATAEPISESDFYDRFRVDVRNADDQVLITYLDNDDPRQKADEETVKYYEDIKEITKSSSDVRFRRLIRANPQLEDWVDDLIEAHEGDANFSLACMQDRNPDQASIPHISVQLIDDDITYFVAVGGQHEQGAVPRDLRLQSEAAARQWIGYYNRIWNDAFEVMRRGMVQETELEAYREHIEDLKSDS